MLCFNEHSRNTNDFLIFNVNYAVWIWRRKKTFPHYFAHRKIKQHTKLTRTKHWYYIISSLHFFWRQKNSILKVLFLLYTNFRTLLTFITFINFRLCDLINSYNGWKKIFLTVLKIFVRHISNKKMAGKNNHICVGNRFSVWSNTGKN